MKRPTFFSIVLIAFSAPLPIPAFGGNGGDRAGGLAIQCGNEFTLADTFWAEQNLKRDYPELASFILNVSVDQIMDVFPLPFLNIRGGDNFWRGDLFAMFGTLGSTYNALIPFQKISLLNSIDGKFRREAKALYGGTTPKNWFGANHLDLDPSNHIESLNIPSRCKPVQVAVQSLRDHTVHYVPQVYHALSPLSRYFLLAHEWYVYILKSDQDVSMARALTTGLFYSYIKLFLNKAIGARALPGTFNLERAHALILKNYILGRLIGVGFHLNSFDLKNVSRFTSSAKIGDIAGSIRASSNLSSISLRLFRSNLLLPSSDIDLSGRKQLEELIGTPFSDDDWEKTGFCPRWAKELNWDLTLDQLTDSIKNAPTTQSFNHHILASPSKTHQIPAIVLQLISHLTKNLD